MDNLARKRSNSPPRTRHSKRMILLDEQNDDWRRTSSPSTSSVTSKASSDSEAARNELNYVTDKFSGFLAEFLAEYASPLSPRSPEGPAERNGADTAPPPSDTQSHSSALPEVAESPAPSSWRSDSQEFTTDSEDGDQDNDDASTVADESNWEDEDLDTPGSPGSDVELSDGIIRRGMYITVILSNRERNTALPCTAKVLEVHDRRGKFTLRLSKSARRATRSMWIAGPRSPAAARGKFASPRP